MSSERVRDRLGAAMGSQTGLSAADRLCTACVDLLGIDGAAVSFVHDGASRGTFGSSGELSRQLDEYQFTLGEGPCLEAVRSTHAVLVRDVTDPRETRWPAFAGEVSRAGIRAVFALPVTIAHAPVGALDLFRTSPGDLSADGWEGGLWAAQLAALPLLDLMSADLDWASAGDGGDGWDQLASLERTEVYQATGTVIAQLDVDATEALVRLRAYAFAHGMTASEAAWEIIERRVRLAADDGPLSSPDVDGGGRR